MTSPTSPPSESIPATRWDVYRDREGNAVTITPNQCAAIRHALTVYGEVCEAGGQGVFDSQTVLGILHFMNAKSALMGRMLYDGRPPLDLPPPTTVMAAPAWHLYDANLCPDCGWERATPRPTCSRDWHPSQPEQTYASVTEADENDHESSSVGEGR